MNVSTAPGRKDGEAVVVVRPSGEIDNPAADELDAEVLRVLDEGGARIILDLTDVTYLNSAGVGVIAMAAKRARARGGDLALVGLQDRPRRAVELVRLDQILIVADTEEEARARLG